MLKAIGLWFRYTLIITAVFALVGFVDWIVAAPLQVIVSVDPEIRWQDAFWSSTWGGTNVFTDAGATLSWMAPVAAVLALLVTFLGFLIRLVLGRGAAVTFRVLCVLGLVGLSGWVVAPEMLQTLNSDRTDQLVDLDKIASSRSISVDEYRLEDGLVAYAGMVTLDPGTDMVRLKVKLHRPADVTIVAVTPRQFDEDAIALASYSIQRRAVGRTLSYPSEGRYLHTDFLSNYTYLQTDIGRNGEVIEVIRTPSDADSDPNAAIPVSIYILPEDQRVRRGISYDDGWNLGIPHFLRRIYGSFPSWGLSLDDATRENPATAAFSGRALQPGTIGPDTLHILDLGFRHSRPGDVCISISVNDEESDFLADDQLEAETWMRAADGSDLNYRFFVMSPYDFRYPLGLGGETGVRDGCFPRFTSFLAIHDECQGIAAFTDWNQIPYPNQSASSTLQRNLYLVVGVEALRDNPGDYTLTVFGYPAEYPGYCALSDVNELKRRLEEVEAQEQG